MALSKVTFQRTDGNLRSALIGEDHISGLIFDTKAAPGTTALGDVHQIFTLKDAENLGITPFSDGVSAYMNGIPHLHISEFFRLNPNGSLYIMFDDCTANFEAILRIQRVAQGSIRQVGVWTAQKLLIPGTTVSDPYTLALVQDINAIAERLADINKPLSVILNANLAGVEADNVTTVFSKFPNIVQSYPRVTALIGQGNSELIRNIQLASVDHANIGWVGAALAIVSLAAVGESVAWVGKFNMIGGEFNSIAFGFGDITVTSGQFNSILPYESVAEPQLDEIETKGYVFPIKYADKDGTFWSKDRTCSDGDYRTISRNRTIDKSRREIRKVLLDRLNSPLSVEPSSGKLSTGDIATFRALVAGVLGDMQNAGEISGYRINISANQNVIATDKLIIQYRLIPKGVASDIFVEEGFAISTSAAGIS